MPLFNLTKDPKILDIPENSSPYAGAAVAVAPKTEQGQNVNVVMDYSWTLSPKTSSCRCSISCN